VRAYNRRYGGLSDQPLPSGSIGTAIDRERFEQVWRDARQVLEGVDESS
jgi:hypothetical protein